MRKGGAEGSDINGGNTIDFFPYIYLVYSHCETSFEHPKMFWSLKVNFATEIFYNIMNQFKEFRSGVKSEVLLCSSALRVQ